MHSWCVFLDAIFGAKDCMVYKDMVKKPNFICFDHSVTQTQSLWLLWPMPDVAGLHSHPCASWAGSCLLHAALHPVQVQSFALLPWSRPYVCPCSPDSFHSVRTVPLPAVASKRGFPGTAAPAAVLYSLHCSATRLRSGLMCLRKTCPWNGQASTQASVPLEYKSKMPNVTLYWFFIFF